MHYKTFFQTFCFQTCIFHEKRYYNRTVYKRNYAVLILKFLSSIIWKIIRRFRGDSLQTSEIS